MVTYYILHNLQNRNLLILPENSILCNASISMLPSAQNTKKIDSIYYVINHQRLRVNYSILCNLQNANLQTSLERHPLVLLIINKKERKK